MSRKPQDTLHELRNSVSSMANDARGPERYVVHSLGALLQGLEIMVEQTIEVNKSVVRFEESVTKFAKASDNVAFWMMVLTVVQIVIAGAALLVWFK